MSQSSKEVKARYRAKHREELRAKGRAHEAQKRRAAGIPALGTPESTANRRSARKATGEAHGNWKGPGVGYVALHAWVHRHKIRTGICAQCGATPEPKPGGFRRVATEWANVSGLYKRTLDDWIELCVTCHRRRDRARRKM